MTRTPWVRALHCLLAWVCAGAAVAAPQDEAVDSVVRQLLQSARDDFALKPTLALDASLRAQAEALAQAHLARVETSLRDWTRQEVAALGADLRGLGTHVGARYANEYGLWQVETTGDAHDRRMVEAWSAAALCATQSGHAPFSRAMLAVQHMPAAERSAGFDAYRTLLGRWGQPRPELPPRPVPSWAERLAPVLRALTLDERPSAEPPLPPLLAWRLLNQPPQHMTEDAHCSLRHWWLQRERARPDADMAALARGWRYASLPDPVERWRRADDKDDVSAKGYPHVAARLDITGTVTLRGRPRGDAPGLEQARVVSRRITVAGIRDVRPVVFETVFDAASLARLQAQTLRGAPDASSEINIDLIWRLE